MSLSDAVYLVYAFVFFQNEASFSVMQPATFLKLYVNHAVLQCEAVTDVEATWHAN